MLSYLLIPLGLLCVIAIGACWLWKVLRHKAHWVVRGWFIGAAAGASLYPAAFLLITAILQLAPGRNGALWQSDVEVSSQLIPWIRTASHTALAVMGPCSTIGILGSYLFARSKTPATAPTLIPVELSPYICVVLSLIGWVILVFFPPNLAMEPPL